MAETDTTESAGNTATLSGDWKAEDVVTPELQAQFDEVFGGESGESKDGDVKTEPTPKRRTKSKRQQFEEDESLASLEEATTEDTPLAAAEDDEEATDDSDGIAPDVDDKDESLGSTLDPLMRHAAKRSGMTDEEIDAFHKHNPALAEKTFTRLHGQLSDLAARYGSLGQAKDPTPDVAGTQPAAAEDMTKMILGRKVLDDMGQEVTVAQKYQGFAEDVLDPLMQMIQEPLRASQEMLTKQKQQATAAEVNSWMSGIDAGLKNIYGSAQSRSEAQLQNFKQLLAAADRFRQNAAAAPGVPELSVTEAMDIAVSVHAAPLVQELERKKLTDQVRSRSGKITARPTNRAGMGSTGEPSKKSDKAAVAAAEKAMREMGML